VRALLDNRIAAVRRRALLTEAQCAASLETLRSSGAWDTYDVSDGPAAGKLGISQYVYGSRKDAYLDDARVRARPAGGGGSGAAGSARPAHGRARCGVAGAGRDRRRGRTALLRGRVPLRRGHPAARRLGTARRGGWAIGEIVAQLAWNLYYAVPAKGGELLVHDRPWSPDLEAHARQELYDYDPATVDGRERVHITFAAGDAVLFSSSNVHAVAESPDGATRVTASSFIGERPDGALVLWS
jgi:hypothetical protein